MKSRFLCAIVLCLCMFAHTQEIEVPWQELKTLYQEKVAREVREQLLPDEALQFRFTIEEARYTLAVTDEIVQGSAEITGRVLGGKPAPIDFFGTETILAEVQTISGGVLLPGQGASATALLPDDVAPFALAADFLVRPQREELATVVSMQIPPALRNRLELRLPEGAKLLQFPGVRDEQGTIHFAGTPRLELEFLTKAAQDAAKPPPEIHLLTRVTLQNDRLMLRTWLWSARALQDPVILKAPETATFISTSLYPSAFKPLDEQRFEIAAAEELTAPAMIEFALPLAADGGETTLFVPVIENNSGRQGRFFIEEPDGGEFAVTGEGLARQLSVERLEAPLRECVGGLTHFMSIPPGTPFHLALHRFEAFGAVTPALATQQLFIAFDESGNALSTLVFEIPAGFGPRLAIEPVPGAEVWSLQVNDAQKQVYRDESGKWIISLDSSAAAVVELAFLTKGPKLALQGTLEIAVPETSLSAQLLTVGVAVPERIELLFVDGPVNPTPDVPARLPRGFVGKPHFFSQSFYKGEGMAVAVSYKEPVNTPPAVQGELR